MVYDNKNDRLEFNCDGDVLMLFLWILIWMAGIVIAKGFWSTLFAVGTGGLWSIYLIMEVIFKHYGII